jgi:hypothetical protein
MPEPFPISKHKPAKKKENRYVTDQDNNLSPYICRHNSIYELSYRIYNLIIHKETTLPMGLS